LAMWCHMDLAGGPPLSFVTSYDEPHDVVVI
jgi:hypothetical protein